MVSFFQKTTPLIVFVHAPKAAGTTVNTFLRQNFSRGQDHCQNLMSDPKQMSKIIKRVDWVSGHIAWNKFSRALNETTNRELRYFATIRNPVDQVISHYNWLIEIYARGPDFYDQHPANIKEVSEQIRAADNTNPSAIIDILELHPGLFLNLQSRFILGDDIVLGSDDFESRYAAYEMICAVPKISTLFTALRHPFNATADFENTAPYHLDPAIFESRSIVNFLEEKNAFDAKLFRLAMA